MSIPFRFQYKTISLRALAALIALACLLCCAAALAEEPSGTQAPEAEYLDDQRESVRAAQRRLIELGLLQGSADGVIGPKTEAALLCALDYCSDKVKVQRKAKSLESRLSMAEDTIAELEGENEELRAEIRELRARLGMN